MSVFEICFFKHKTAYDMRISDWSSDVCSSDLTVMAAAVFEALFHGDDERDFDADPGAVVIWFSDDPSLNEQTRFRLGEASDRLNWSDLVVVGNSFNRERRSEEHTSELQSLMRISYAVFCLKNKKKKR